MRLAYPYRFEDDGGGGGFVHVRQFLWHARRLGHEVLTPTPSRYSAGVLPTTRLGRFLLGRRVDCFYVRIEEALPPLRWFESPYYELCGRPPLVWEFNTVPEYGRMLGRSEQQVGEAIAAFRRMADHCTLAVCVSDAIAEYVRSELRVGHVVTVPNGSDPDHFTPGTADPEGRPFRAVWIGSADVPWHDIQLLEDAAAILAAQPVALELHAIGLEPRTGTSSLICHGRVDYRELPGLLRDMDVGILAYEAGAAEYSSPLKLFDYMAAGLAVVGTPNRQFAELTRSLGMADCVVPFGDAAALAARLLALAEDRAAARGLGARLRTELEARFTWAACVERVFREIELALGR